MGNDGASNTGNITSQEGNPGLLEGGIGGFGFPEVGIDFVNGGFERREFHHRVWNLTAPERVESFVESIDI